MILRPEPPSSPCSGCTRSTGEWKCCSKSFLRTSMKIRPHALGLTSPLQDIIEVQRHHRAKVVIT